MVSKIEKQSHPLNLFNAPTKKERGSCNNPGVAKILTTAVGFLAAAQGFGTVAARPLNGLDGLDAPKNRYESFRTMPHLDEKQPMQPWMNDTALNVRQGGRALLGEKNQQTWVVNQSDAEIEGSTTYNDFCINSHSKFQNRVIPPHGKDHDQYAPELANNKNCHNPEIGLRLKGTAWTEWATFNLQPDESVLVTNTPNAGTLDVYKSAFGSLYTSEGPVLGRIVNG